METLRSRCQTMIPAGQAFTARGLAAALTNAFGYRPPAPLSLRDLLVSQSRLLLAAAHDFLKSDATLGLGDPLGDVFLDDGAALKAYQLFKGENGTTISVEVNQDPIDAEPSVWVSIPRRGIPGGRDPVVHRWCCYRRINGKWVTPPHAGMLSTPYPGPPSQPVLKDTGLYTHYKLYEWDNVVFPGRDPPHWSPIFTWTEEHAALVPHEQMQDPAAQDAAKQRIAAEAPKGGDDLTDWTMRLWPPTTLRGLVVNAAFPSGDLNADHSVGFMKSSNEVPTGPLLPVEIHPGSPVMGMAPEEYDAYVPSGLDWDMSVEPDKDVAYLASESRPTRVPVEVEHFTIPLALRPQYGEWLQATGRWVVDCGHSEEGFTKTMLVSEDVMDDEGNFTSREVEREFPNGFYTEIHPPELLVSSARRGDYAVYANVTVTGAWTGNTLSFVVFPPPRPSSDAKLKYLVRSLAGRALIAEPPPGLVILPWPVINPNHLLCYVEQQGSSSISTTLANSGAVGLYADRGFGCVIDCWWGVPFASLRGSIRHVATKTRSGKGAGFLFYRPADIPGGPWERLPVDAEGSFELPSLAPGKAYWLRPGASGYDFEGVPRLVELTEGAQEIHFEGKPRRSKEPAPFSWPPERAERRAPKGVDATTWQRAMEQTEPAILLVHGFDMNDAFAVSGSGTGVDEAAEVYVHLFAWVDGHGAPVQSAEELRFTPDADRALLVGAPRGGVAGARVLARLVVGDEAIGYRIEHEIEGVTDEGGNLRITVQAGSHVEDTKLEIQVLDNPVNPWLLPVARGPVATFMPALEGDDARERVPYALRLDPIPSKPLKLEKLRRGRRRERLAEFLQEVREGREREPITAASGDAPKRGTTTLTLPSAIYDELGKRSMAELRRARAPK